MLLLSQTVLKVTPNFVEIKNYLQPLGFCENAEVINILILYEVVQTN